MPVDDPYGPTNEVPMK